jgi:hypothetical protein
MKSKAFLLMLISLISVGASRSETNEGCSFSITGMWRSDVTLERSPIFINFLPSGWVRLVEHTKDALPQDFEIVAEVMYRLDKPDAPRSIEYTTKRGNNVFLQGVTSLEIADYSDDSFTTIEPESGLQTRWVRVETHRYFLTFVADSRYAFAMWSALDGRGVVVEALGTQPGTDAAGKTIASFGPIPAEIYDRRSDQSNDQSNKGKSAILRLELTEAEFARTNKVYQMWNKYVETHTLLYTDPYLNALEFMRATAESFNQCSEKIKLQKLTPNEREEIIAKQKLPQYLLEYINAMRKRNDELHVTDGSFPWNWRPSL